MTVENKTPLLSCKWVPAGWRMGKAKGAKGGVETHVMIYRLDLGISGIVQEVPADMEKFPKDPRTRWMFSIPRVDTSALENTFDTASEAMEAGSKIISAMIERLAKELRALLHESQQKPPHPSDRVRR